jgi:tetratricopeptide (TPR) repeat protein
MSAELENKYLESDSLIKQGDFIGAKSILESLIFDYPKSGMVHNSLGWLYRTQMENYKQAAEHFKASINFDPEYPHSYFNYAYMLLDLDDPKGARQVLDKAFSSRSVNKPKLRYELARVYEYEGDWDKAMEYYRLAMNSSINNELLSDIERDMERCQRKIANNSIPLEEEKKDTPEESK